MPTPTISRPTFFCVPSLTVCLWVAICFSTSVLRRTAPFQEQVAILKEFGRWTKKHKEAIYDTRAGIPGEHFQGYSTLNKAGDILYLYLPYKPNGPIEVKGLMNKVNRVWVVGDGEIISSKVFNKNYWSEVPGNLYINVPERSLDPMITVVAVLLDGPIKLYRGAGKVIESN